MGPYISNNFPYLTQFGKKLDLGCFYIQVFNCVVDKISVSFYLRFQPPVFSGACQAKAQGGITSCTREEPRGHSITLHNAGRSVGREHSQTQDRHTQILQYCINVMVKPILVNL